MEKYYALSTITHIFQIISKHCSHKQMPKLLIKDNALYLYLKKGRELSKKHAIECERNGWHYDREKNFLTFHAVEVAELVTSDDNYEREQGVRHQQNMKT